MAFDYGSQKLEISNPFKIEGKIQLLAGFIIAALAVYPLINVVSSLETSPLLAWGQVGLGLSLLFLGFSTIAKGGLKAFRFYVGRSAPSSLAQNFSPTEQDNSKAESSRGSLVYTSDNLESMLMARKNLTYQEPQGWLARMVHTLIPRLIFAPYQLRNIVQEIFSVLASSIVALLAFGLAFFITATGLAGDAGDVIISFMSIFLVIYLILIWRNASRNISSKNNKELHAKTAKGLSMLVASAIVVPTLIGFVYENYIVTNFDTETITLIVTMGGYSAGLNLVLLLVAALIVMVPTFVMVRERLKLANPVTEVSEYRDNLQEQVHPNELFINVDNIIMGNRRYKDTPNRLYKALKPTLNEQSQGKGAFKGELLIETQPEYKPFHYSPLFRKIRFFSTLGAQILTVVSALLGMWLFYTVSNHLLAVINTENNDVFSLATLVLSSGAIIVTLLFSWRTFASAGRLLNQISHLMWAELQFNSLLLSFKAEGTFMESKVSTGAAIHDSTKSENTVVKSSITPLILSSRITTSTYAIPGALNLEMPRIVLNMHANESELQEILGEMKGFLGSRETIAGIRNKSDQDSIQNVQQMNQISKQGGSASLVSLADESVERIEDVEAVVSEGAEDLSSEAQS
ncbi:hypothetical protein [Marinospirillum insulare]|uniref:Uncharacterized protein n=1 Tax=Marinospirillum insulare TaxID=217169 RepID=A0ABQ5ZUY8_9GAMM|nr:hypothetical protein [Marinospirillum insulare]GLR63969.1 hypothetical protein GCM10007878_14070 [Marinospirillum insulare]